MTEPGSDRVEVEVVDAHLHLWDLSTGDYTWNTPALGPVHASFDAATAAATLASAGVGRAVLVQAADTVGDSERLFAAAAEHAWVAGVVAWVPLDDPAQADRLLDRWAATGRLCGVRQLLHDHPDPALLDAPAVRATLSLVAGRGLPLDVPDAWPGLWPAVSRLVEDVPDLSVVLDHLGKPALGLGAQGRSTNDELQRWEQGLARLAEHPSVVAKLSGLGAALRPGATLDARSVRPLVDAALRTFGPERLMFGGDWPVSLGDAGYPRLVTEMRDGLAELGDDERSAVLQGTARRVYALGPAA
ncbi:MAG: amidohydrolase family protein [Janthinobacterium lividum]